MLCSDHKKIFFFSSWFLNPTPYLSYSSPNKWRNATSPKANQSSQWMLLLISANRPCRTQQWHRHFTHRNTTFVTWLTIMCMMPVARNPAKACIFCRTRYRTSFPSLDFPGPNANLTVNLVAASLVQWTVRHSLLAPILLRYSGGRKNL